MASIFSVEKARLFTEMTGLLNSVKSHILRLPYCDCLQHLGTGKINLYNSDREILLSPCV